MLNSEIKLDIEKYIESNYVPEKISAMRFYKLHSSADEFEFRKVSPVIEPVLASYDINDPKISFADDKSAIAEMLEKIDDNFAVTLLKLIDLKDMDDVECYKKANVSKQTWYKIMNEKDYKPSKNTVLAFAIALGLDLSETERLLSTVGYALSKSSKFDLIIKYFIEKGERDIFKINEALFEFDQACLGV